MLEPAWTCSAVVTVTHLGRVSEAELTVLPDALWVRQKGYG